MEDPSIPKSYTSVYTKEFYDNNFKLNTKKIKGILDDLNKMEEKEKNITNQKDTTSQYQQQKILKMKTMGKNAISKILQNQVEDLMVNVYNEEKKQNDQYDNVLISIEKKQFDEKIKNYQKTMINQFDYFFSELRHFVLKPDMDTPILFVGLAYTSAFVDKVLFGANVTNAVCKVIEFAYIQRKMQERMF